MPKPTDTTSDVVRGQCPRCHVPLAPAAGALHEDVCAQCQGRHLAEDAATRILDVLGVSQEMLHELLAHFGGRSVMCAACGQGMRPVTLRGVHVDVCKGCGGVWCDPGELSRLSRGLFGEVRAHAGPLVVGAPLEVEPEGSWAVLLRRPNGADVDVVGQALVRATRRYTAADAAFRVRRGQGVLAESLAADEAMALVQALAAAHVEADAVVETELALPSAFTTRQLSVEGEALVIGDALGRPRRLAVADVSVCTLGLTRGIELAVTTTAPSFLTRHASRMGDREPEQDHRSTEIREREELVVALLFDDPLLREMPAQRIHVATDKPTLAAMRPAQRAELQGALQALVARAPRAALGSSVVDAAQGAPVRARFESVRELERSLSWLWWQRQRGRIAREGSGG